MYKVAVMQRLQAACHITGNVQQKSLFINAVVVSTMTAQVRLHVSLYTSCAQHIGLYTCSYLSTF